MKDTIIALLEGAVDALKHQGVLPNDVQPVIKVDPTKDKAHGDYATNLALMLAKPASMKPRELADATGSRPARQRRHSENRHRRPRLHQLLRRRRCRRPNRCPGTG